jgi:dynein heavy chain 2
MIEERIPSEDEPRLFGLPANIRFSWEATESRKSIAQLRHLHTGATDGTSLDRAVWNEQLSPVLALWKRLNQGSSLHSMTVPLPKPSQDPIVEVLSLEMVHAINLVSLSLHDLLEVIICRYKEYTNR